MRNCRHWRGKLARAIGKERTLFEGHRNRNPVGPVTTESDGGEVFARSEDKLGTHRQVIRLCLSFDGAARGRQGGGVGRWLGGTEVEQDGVGGQVRSHGGRGGRGRRATATRAMVRRGLFVLCGGFARRGSGGGARGKTLAAGGEGKVVVDDTRHVLVAFGWAGRRRLFNAD